MPLEALLAMYGYGNADPMAGGDHRESNSSNSEEEILNNHDLTLDKEEVRLKTTKCIFSLAVLLKVWQAVVHHSNNP